MSTSSTVINRNIEIVQALCTTTSAVALTGLLSYLQTTYPASAWTEDLLLTYLDVGVSQGLYIRVGTNPLTGVVEGYNINKNALKLNTRNQVYGPYCSRFSSVPAFSSGGGCGCKT